MNELRICCVSLTLQHIQHDPTGSRIKITVENVISSQTNTETAMQQLLINNNLQDMMYSTLCYNKRKIVPPVVQFFVQQSLPVYTVLYCTVYNSTVQYSTYNTLRFKKPVMDYQQFQQSMIVCTSVLRLVRVRKLIFPKKFFGVGIENFQMSTHSLFRGARQ